jgi:hypothetical protein
MKIHHGGTQITEKTRWKNSVPPRVSVVNDFLGSGGTGRLFVNCFQRLSLLTEGRDHNFQDLSDIVKIVIGDEL